jgi:signal transduction histidine kinase
MVINDLREDQRFAASPFVSEAPNAKFYAGISITTPDGYRLGTVCVLDDKPRELTEEQLKCLRLLSDYTIKLIELRKTNDVLIDKEQALMSVNRDLEQYAYAIAHDIKAPLRIMSSFTSILKKSAQPKLTIEEKEFFAYIESSAKELSRYTQNLLHFSKNIQLDTHSCTNVQPSVLLKSLDELLNKNNEVAFFYDEKTPTIFTSEVGLSQILQNLISNAIRYRDPDAPTPYVAIKVSAEENYFHFEVIDNGLGIKEKHLESIFHLFTRDKMNKESTGIGLNVVKRLVEKMNGTIAVQSKRGKGTTVEFTIERIMKRYAL